MPEAKSYRLIRRLFFLLMRERLISDLYGTLTLPLLYIYVKMRAKSAHTLDDAVRVAMELKLLDVSFTANQSPTEVSRLLSLLSERRPRVVLEIGTGFGGTLFLFATVTRPGGKLVSVDSYMPAWRRVIYNAFGIGGQRVVLVKADSHRKGTFEFIKGIVGQGVDFLFIDDGHMYAEVKRDYELYSGLVRRGGVIALHDINPDHQTLYGHSTPEKRWSGGVPQFWRELERGNRAAIEIIERWGQDGYGIGVLFI